MKVESRNVYVTNDGKEFINEDEALAHEAKCNIDAALENSNIYFTSTSPDEVAEWIIDNRAFLLDELARIK